MSRLSRRVARTVALLVSFCFATCASDPALAQAAEASAARATPPELVEAMEAPYPELARAERLEGTVVLRLSIDAEGNVTEAVVLEPIGNGFDEAARDAALRFRFKPALRDGQPIAARIHYPYAFKLPPEPTPAPAAAAPGSESQRSAPAIAPAPSPRPPAEAAVDVEIAGQLSEADRLRQSAEAVNVVELTEAKRETADLGEVLARAQGVTVRREGGLGSNSRFSLNGLDDDQIRFFLDGVPLELSGYPFRATEVPINLLDRVEIYRGVVPIRFGANALGGAVNLVTEQSFENRVGVSYQTGSYGLHRVTLEGRYKHDPTGLYAHGTSFFDVAQNNYDIDVEIPDSRGRPRPATVPRFHDAYMAYGGTVEGGVVERPWAKRLTLKVFGATYDKELQHNTVMTVPYGEVEYGETVYGATARYDVDVTRNLSLELVGSYAHRTIDFVDDATWVYNWRGERVNSRRVGGEIEADPTDQTSWQHGLFGRAVLEWSIVRDHALRVSLSPMLTTRTGEDRLNNPIIRDPLTADRKLFTFVSGLEYELNLLDKRLTNIVFVKDYIYDARSEETLPGNIWRDRDEQVHRQGVGGALRYRFTPWLIGKASYEYATRLPRADEVFGDAMLIKANLDLKPEVSHNFNVGPRLDLKRTGAGDFIVDINAFRRDVDQQIVLLGNERRYMYQNVYAARSQGLENTVGWYAPRRLVHLYGQLTWQDFRNASSQGTFGDMNGDRIPHRPYLWGAWLARLRFRSLPGPSDTVEPFYYGRYVHEYFRGWESYGRRDSKQVVPEQVLHTVGVTWTVHNAFSRVSSTLEVDNLTDAMLQDAYGVLRPRRGVYVKLTGELL